MFWFFIIFVGVFLCSVFGFDCLKYLEIDCVLIGVGGFSVWFDFD